MSKLLDAFWRAAMYCLHPRVIALSILPLVIMAAISLGVGYFFWDNALEFVRTHLESVGLVNSLIVWLEGLGLNRLRSVLAPVVVLFLSIPAIVVASLLFVAWLMTPAMVALVAERRFSKLERKKGGSMLTSVLWSLGSTLLAVIALLVSIPLWLIPPLILVLPPLIWGWLTYRVMSYDALVDHASAEERKAIFKEHRGSLLAIGIISGYLGAAPSILWASGAMFIAMAPILVPIAIWIYTLVFAFSSLWFAHFTLSALEQHRLHKSVMPAVDRRAPPEVKVIPHSDVIDVPNSSSETMLTGPSAAPSSGFPASPSSGFPAAPSSGFPASKLP